MIISIAADKPSFKPVHFKPGMNVILADRTDASSKRDTRNGLGKSLLIEIIHFCLGAGTKRGPDAYSDPFTHYRKQLTWDIQANNALLLGLNHDYATDLQGLRDQKKHIDNLKREIKEGALDRYLGSIGELEAEHVRLKDQYEANKEGLETFNVLPQYRKMETEANRLTTEINNLRNERVRLERRSQYYRDSLKNDAEPSAEKVVEVYNSAGMVLPEAVVRQFKEVETFHSTITTNRKEYLHAEMERLTEATQSVSAQLTSTTESRAELMQTLRAHGPWDEYQKLTEQQSELKGQLGNLTDRIKTINEIQEGASRYKIDKERLIQRTRLDYAERRPIWEPAISKFNANSQALYEVPGSLVIEVDDKGYTFNVEIERSGSQGIGSMKVFCYDLLLAELWSKKQQTPGILIHDSLVFDPVDERQRALSLELAAKRAEENGFQYICTLNSDMVPYSEFEENFDFNDYVKLRLTDDSPEGGLLGFRF